MSSILESDPYITCIQLSTYTKLVNKRVKVYLFFPNVTDLKLSWVNNLKADNVGRPGKLYLFDKSHLSWVLLDNYKKQYLNNKKNVLLI